MDFDALNNVARKLMLRRKAHPEREIGSIYEHGQRVARMVITLRKEILPGDSSMDDILRLAAIFHDVGKGIEPHADYGPPIMQQAVRGLVSTREAAEAARLIAAHCDRRPNEPVHDVWERLLQDADLLDHIGTYTIWMDIQYSASQDAGFSQTAEAMKEKAEAYAKHHRTQLNFPISKAIYDDRIALYLEFAKRIQSESRGKLRIPK